MSQNLTYTWMTEQILNVDYCNQESANSLTPDLISELISILEQQKPLALVFTSSHSRVYCSGGNLKKYAEMTEAESRKSNQQMRDLLLKFSTQPIHTVAYVTGDCYGGGLEFLSAFDEVHSAPYCLFGFWQKKQSLSFGWGGYERLKKRLSEHTLIYFLQNAKTLLASEALRVGLIDSVEADRNKIVKRVSLCINTENFKEIKKLKIDDETTVFEKLWYSKDHQQKLQRHK